MLPIIISAPHAKSHITDPEIRNKIALSDYEIWKCSDPYTGELEHFTCAQFKHIAANHRLICDLNRKPDYENAFHEEDFFGRTVFKTGEEFTRKEKEKYIKKYWNPYHEKIKDSVKKLEVENNTILIVDYHNTSGDHPLGNTHEYMPSIVISNLEDESSIPTGYLKEFGANIFKKLEVGVEINTIFQGGYNTHWFSRLKSASKIYAFQLEYNLDHIFNPISRNFDREAFDKMQTALNEALIDLYDILD